MSGVGRLLLPLMEYTVTIGLHNRRGLMGSCGSLADERDFHNITPERAVLRLGFIAVKENPMRFNSLWLPFLSLSFLLGGCASFYPRLPIEAQRYRLDVELDPEQHHIQGRSAIELIATSGNHEKRTAAIDLELHPALKITKVEVLGGTLLAREARKATKPKDGVTQPRTHRLIIADPQDALTIEVWYEGQLFQDVAAGEKPGEIHNFTMKAHIGPDGIYLAGGTWYPMPKVDKDVLAAPADYTLVAKASGGMELVAGGETDPTLSDSTGRRAWRTPFPVPDMVLVGGKHDVHSDTHGGIALRAHLKPEQAAQASGLLATTKKILDRYQPLIGPYPAREYSIVDNFFSSGFAFPTFTLLGSAVIDMGERSQTAHGYIDHEMLHSWWGNGIFVDPHDGNWCEALASYGANYYGFVLDGDESEARRKRRNHAHFLSRDTAALAKPLGTFGQEGGCSRGVAYQKGASVFHMLARTMGQDTFWAAMRRFTAEYTGRYASWSDIQKLCTAQAGQSLDTFFAQWVRRGGAPELRLEDARYDADRSQLIVTMTQGSPAFDLTVPLRIHGESGVTDLDVAIQKSEQVISIPASIRPQYVEIDPDYHIFRRVPRTHQVPTTSLTRAGNSFTTVLPIAPAPESYLDLQKEFERSFKPREIRALTVAELTPGILAHTSILIVGDAVRDPYVAGFLSAVEFPVQWSDSGFILDGKEYAGPDQAILASGHHPDHPEGGITVLFANSESAIPRAMLIPFYEHSIVVFDGGRATLKRDVEKPLRVKVGD